MCGTCCVERILLVEKNKGSVSPAKGEGREVLYAASKEASIMDDTVLYCGYEQC